MIALAITAALYTLTTLLYLRYALGSRSRSRRWATRSLQIGFLVHAGSLPFWIMEVGTAQITHVFAILPLVSWLMVGAYLLIEARFGLSVLGTLLVPLATINLIVSLAATPWKVPMAVPVQGAVLILHVLGAVLGLGAFTLASGISALYLFQEWQLKNKRFGPVYRHLPSLETMDAVSFKIIGIGFPVYTAAVLLGALRAQQSGGFGSMGKAFLLALVAWVLYAVVLQGRLTAGWRGRRAAFLVVGGFVACTLVMIRFLVP